MVSVLALLSLFALFSAASAWMTYARRRTRLLPAFATLLDRPESIGDFTDVIVGSLFLRGEFRGRRVVILMEHREDEDSRLVISMETHAARTMDTYDFADYRGDREGERALFALEVKHDLTLRHLDGHLKAQWSLGSLSRSFDRPKWQSVLEAMDTLAGSIERRATRPPVAAAL